MSRYEHKNWGDLQNHVFMKGTVTDVNSDDDTANVTIEGGADGSGVPIFYHCKPDSEKRSNGAIEGAAAGFYKDDEVIVMCTVEGEPVRIVGFVGGIKACEGEWVFFSCGGCWFVWDIDKSDYADVRDENDEPVPQPYVPESPANEKLPHEFIEYDDDEWREVWTSDVGAGEHHVDDSDIPDVYTSVSEGGHTWELANTADKEDSETTPATPLFGSDIISTYHQSRTIGGVTDSDYYGNVANSHFQVEWDNSDMWDYCRFSIASRNGSNDQLHIAIRYLDENYMDRVSDVHTDTEYTAYVNDAKLLTYRKRSVYQCYMPPGYMDEAWVSEENVRFEKYVERKIPWGFYNGTMQRAQLVSDVRSYFPDHPDYETVRDNTIYGIGFWMVNDANPIFYNGRYRYTEGQWFSSFQADKISSGQLAYGLCAEVDEEDKPYSYQGTDECNWGEDDGCVECTEPSASGTMYDLHNDHRATVGADPLVPNSVIAGVAQSFAEAMAAGSAEYSHDGFDERVAEVLEDLDCAAKVMGENLNRVDSADPDPVATCFQEWLDSSGHRENIEFSDFTMMGYGSSGEYHVVIFGTAEYQCLELPPGISRYKTSHCCMQMSDLANSKLKRKLGLDESDPFPWEGVLDVRYTPLGPIIDRNGWSAMAEEVLTDDKARDLGGNFVRTLGVFCDVEEKRRGLVNVTGVFPYSYIPKNFVNPVLYEANETQIKEACHFRASHDVGEDSDPNQKPTEMDRDVKLEAALKEAFILKRNIPFDVNSDSISLNFKIKPCKQKVFL